MNGRKNIDEDVAPRRDSWGERSLKAAAGAGVAAIFLVFWYGVDILLLVFAGALLGVLLGGLAALVCIEKGFCGWSLLLIGIAQHKYSIGSDRHCDGG